ncbi:MAG: RNA methyltransferase [Flavobacteriaceae bacterium]|nr:RNA methyltransferase [Flavobacteriaceae bacterium]
MRKLKIDELQRVDIATYQQQAKIPVVILCDNIRSMYNVGSVFRTADAFSIEKIYLCGITARPPHKEIRKTALGADESVEWEYTDSAVQTLKSLQNQGYISLVIEQVDKSIMLEDLIIDSEAKYVLIFGNEVEGVQQELIDLCSSAIEIPQSGTKHSLNISVCAGIVLWQFYKTMHLKIL